MSDAEHGKGAREDAKALLLEDYRYRSESLWKNEQGGETRVNLFIGFATLVVGALVTLATSEQGLKGEALRVVVLAGLAAVFVGGHITLLRLLIRNKHTDECKRSLDIIRQTFKDHLDESGILLGYYPVGFPRPRKMEEPSQEKRESTEANERELRKFGGLAHTAAAFNSLLLAGIAGMLVYPLGSAATMPDLIKTCVLGLAVFILALYNFTNYISRCEERIKEEMREGMPTHTGGLVYKYENNTVQYLIVGPKDKSAQWVLPKGHVEKGESHGEAAVREVFEETGVVAKIVCTGGIIEFDNVEGIRDGKQKRKNIVKFYLMEFLLEQSEGDGRLKEWRNLEEASRMLTFPDTKRVLQLAEKRRLERSIASGSVKTT